MDAQMRGGRKLRDTQSCTGNRNNCCSLGRVTDYRERVLGNFYRTTHINIQNNYTKAFIAT